MYICGTLPYDQTAEGHQHVFRHFWARTREKQREEVRQDPGGLLARRRQQLVLDWPIWSPAPRPPTHFSTDGSALDDTVAKRHHMVGCAPLPSDRDSRLPAGFRNHIVVLTSRFAPQDNFSEFQVLFPDLFTTESLENRFAVRTLQVLGQDISNELDQPT